MLLPVQNYDILPKLTLNKEQRAAFLSQDYGWNMPH